MADDRPKILWTPAKAKLLRKAHAAAVEAKQDSFIFDGHLYVTDFAKYLLQYLDLKFKS